MWGVFVAETRSQLAERGGCPQLVQLSGTFMILNKLVLTQRRIHFPWPSWSARAAGAHQARTAWAWGRAGPPSPWAWSHLHSHTFCVQLLPISDDELEGY